MFQLKEWFPGIIFYDVERTFTDSLLPIRFINIRVRSNSLYKSSSHDKRSKNRCSSSGENSPEKNLSTNWICSLLTISFVAWFLCFQYLHFLSSFSIFNCSSLSIQDCIRKVIFCFLTFNTKKAKTLPSKNVFFLFFLRFNAIKIKQILQCLIFECLGKGCIIPWI